MRKIKTFLLLFMILLATSACDTKNNDGLHILTTVYPINYLISEIYNTNNLTSIYPDGTDISSYTLTEKQINEYSNNDIFIYNGLSNELTIAKNLINKNRKIKVIDVAYGLKFNNGMEELWLSPNYFLMLATTIKNNLEDFTESKYTNEEIEANYKDLEETLSIMDAELRSLANNAKSVNKNTIVTSSNMFKYLENYGFHIISLEEEENLSTINLNNIKNNFKSGNYTTIFIKDTEKKSDLINTLEKEYNAKVVSINTMTTLSDEDKKNNETYLTIMHYYLEKIKNATLRE